jgi:hypothetical protein
MSAVVTTGVRETWIVVVSFSMTADLVESDGAPATALISMAGHAATASWRAEHARLRQVSSENRVLRRVTANCLRYIGRSSLISDV